MSALKDHAYVKIHPPVLTVLFIASAHVVGWAISIPPEVPGALRLVGPGMVLLGFLLMLIGFPLNSGNIWGILLAPVFVISMNSLVIEKEEAYLGEKFRDAYTGYRSRVRRWL